MPLFLKSEKKPTLPGMTLYSDPLLGAWGKPTGVYVPPGVDIDSGVVNVVLWLHGWFVSSINELFSSDRAAVRDQVLASGKPVILIAPHLGHAKKGASATYHNSVAELTGSWGEMFLNQVLSTLALARDPDTYEPPWKRSDLSLAGLTQRLDPTPGLRLGKLVIACHSGGGDAMRNLVAALGRYKRNLAECWGFDCLYAANGTPDDAGFWHKWASGGDGHPVYISYGRSTVGQSVKLDLMRQGLATDQGERSEPKGPEVPRLNVRIGIPIARGIDDIMGLDDLRAAKAGDKFVEQAAASVKKNAGWPTTDDGLMEMHYRIARDGLLERLKGASFL